MSTLLEGLNTEQMQAVQHVDGPLLIVAGAGTGKTTVITRRIAHLVAEGLAKPDEIVALTFTEKAAGEMAERVDMLMPLGHYDPWICTFHGFCERILKQHALDIGLPNDFRLLDDIQQWVLVYKNLSAFTLSYYKPLGNPGKFIDALLSHFSRCKDEMITPEQYLEHARFLRLQEDQPVRLKKRKKVAVTAVSHALPREEENDSTPTLTKKGSTGTVADEAEIERLEEIANAYHVYQKLLIENNYLDFGDLITYTLELFKKRPNILAYYQKKFKFVMVDEFQDTNLAQYELVKMLAGSTRNLTVVGDDDQSIYKFRGASVSNILKFQEDYPDVKQITLAQNYRSGQNILNLAYQFIQANNPDRLEVKLAIDKKLKASAEIDGGTVGLLEATDLSGELNLVAEKILQKQQESGDSWNDFAVLIRANSAAEELLPVLAANGIPYTFVANKGLYKKPIIVDILAYLKVLNNYHDSQSLYRVLQLPAFHIPGNELSTILHASHRKGWSLFEGLQNIASVPGTASGTKATAQKLLTQLEKHAQQTRRLNAAELLVHVIRDMGLERKLKDDTPENAENRELVEQFYKKIEQFEQQGTDKSLHAFLEYLHLEMQAGSDGVIKFDPNLGPESVKVMTIHSSKGLEFKYVFIINMVDQRFPTREKADAIELPRGLIKEILPEGDFHLQEERRLFYVGLTRAKQFIYLSWARDYGGSRTKKPSVFLVETKLVPAPEPAKATGKVVFTRPEHLPVVYKTPPYQFSYSQLNDFEMCPLKYKYQHYLKLPVPGSCHLSFGQTIHKVFEEYLATYKNNLEMVQQDLFGNAKSGELPDMKFLETAYQRDWVDDWYRDKQEKEEYRQLGTRMLKSFYEHMQANPCRPKYVEKFFKLKLGQYNFVGKIDRADQVADGIEIFDYKTGKKPKADKHKDLDQLYIYQWAAQDYLKEKVLGLQYWYLQEPAGEQFLKEDLADAEKIESLKARLLELIEKIIYTARHDLFKEEHKKSKDHRCEFEDLE